MFGFFFKKNTWDIWENIFYVLILNFMFLLVGFGAFFLKTWFWRTLGFARFTFSLLVFVWVFTILSLAAGPNALKIAGFDSVKFSGFFSKIGESVKDGLLLGSFIWVLFNINVISVPFYYGMWRGVSDDGNPLYLIPLMLIVWFTLTTVFALQWFIPIRSAMHNNFLKILKKCYIVFLDNLGFSFGLFFLNLLNLVISVLTVTVMPGINGIILTQTNAFRLRLYKYDWLEVNPDLTPAERKNVPWDQLLAKDKKQFGHKTFKTILFPWKENQ